MQVDAVTFLGREALLLTFYVGIDWINNKIRVRTIKLLGM